MAFEYDTRRREDPAEKRLTSDELRSIRNARNSLGLKFAQYGAIAGMPFFYSASRNNFSS